MRLIDADRLKSYIDCGHLRPPTEVCFSELDVCNMIDKAPTVSAEVVQGWIPVSERLPNIGDTFLVTVMVGTRMKTDVASNFGSYIDGFWDTFNDWIEDEECHVTAWMPLPEPYEGGDSE